VILIYSVQKGRHKRFETLSGFNEVEKAYDLCLDEADKDWKVYPTPARDLIYVSGLLNIKQIEIYSALGKKLTESMQIPVSLQDIPDGLYFIRIKTEYGLKYTPLLVRK